MKKPEFPKNEEARLKALRSLNILDSAFDERFDQLTRLAKHLCDVPIALVSLIDEGRQWFKSCQGLSVRETHRDISFCGHAILGLNIFVIPDALKDERFADNPLVTGEPNIRFYAGRPIRLADGNTLGTLCLIDQKPRYFSDTELSTLNELAVMAEKELAAIQLSAIDELTNILNKSGFLRLSQLALELCHEQKKPAAVAYITLNGLKEENIDIENFESNSLLVQFAELTSQTCREHDLVARIEKNTFAILFINTNSDVANQLLSTIEKAFNQFRTSTKEINTASMSYSTIDFNASKHNTIELLLEDAIQVNTGNLNAISI